MFALRRPRIAPLLLLLLCAGSIAADDRPNRFGALHDDWSVQIGRRLPPRLMNSLGRALLATKWFSRHVVLDTWFLRTNEPAFQ